MNCPDCRDRLQRWLDARTRPNATLSGGKGGATPPLPALCSACSEWAAAARRLDRGLCLLTPPTPSPSLTNRVVARVAAERRSRRRRLLFAVGAAAAAAILLVVVWQTVCPHSPAPGPGPASEPQPFVRAREPAPQPPEPTLRDSMAEAGDAVASLTSRTADETVARTKVLLPVVTDPTLGQLDLGPSPLDPTAHSLRETGEGVSAGLGPVTDSARRAVGLFFRELPPMEARPKAGL